jgi:hypothetical protein
VWKIGELKKSELEGKRIENIVFCNLLWGSAIAVAYAIQKFRFPMGIIITALY